MLGIFAIVGPMSEQFMLPLGLADIISCCVMSCFIVFYVGK